MLPVRLKEIFAQAMQLKSAVDREHYLAEACQGDAELRKQIDSLLVAHEQAGDFLNQTIQLPLADFEPEPLGSMIGRYKLLEKIGEGGFGVVFMAEQQEPVQRKVALKIIKAGMDTREVIARFEAERQALALMDYPNIAKVLDAGTTEAKRPYFVMELVRGLAITDYCDQASLSTAERLKLFIKVCQAVQHAHQKAVIHRDLKPSNILVTLHDGEPVPKVIDFGVAKALGQKLTEKTLFTAFRQMIGTPAYMSPEQAEMSGLDVDTRSDIYSLGVLLYELLTGVTPFDKEALAKAALDEIRRMIRETEPPKPSTRLRTLGEKIADVAKRRHAEPAVLSQLVRGDLDWIVMKCLEKDRTRRYETASGLATDVERHLNTEPVLAAPPSAVYRLQRFARRHRVALATALAFVVLLVSGAVMSLSQAWRANRYAREADTQRRTATNEAARATLALADSEHARKQGLALAYANSIALAYRELQNGDETMARVTLDSCSPELRGWEWYHLKRLANSALWTAQVPALDSRIPDVSNVSGVRAEFTHDGALLAVFGNLVRPAVFDTHTGKKLFDWSSPEHRYVDFTTFSTDGRWLAVDNGEGTKFVDTLEPVKAQDSTLIWKKLIPAEQKWISITSKRGELQMTGVPVDLFAIPDPAWQRDGLLSPRPINTALGNRFDNDDAFTAEWQGRMALWVAQSEPVRKLVRDAKKTGVSILHVERAGDDFLLVSGTSDGKGSPGLSELSPLSIRVSSLTEPGRAWEPQLPSSAVPVRFRIGFLNNALHLFVASVAIERSSSGLFVIPLGETPKPEAAHYNVDDARMNPYRMLREPKSTSGEPKFILGPYYGAADMVLDMERETMATAGLDCKVRLWNPRLSQETALFRGHGAAVSAVACHPDGNLIASASREGEIGVWDQARSSAAVKIAQMKVGDFEDFRFSYILFNPQHNVIACPVKSGEFAIIDLASGSVRTIPSVVSISDDGNCALHSVSRSHYSITEISSGRQIALLPSRLEGTWGSIPLSHFSGNLEWQAFTTNDNQEIAFLNTTNGTLSPARVEVTWRPEKQEQADPILAINHDATLMICRRSLKEAGIMRISQATGAITNIGHIRCSKFIGFLENERFAAVVPQELEAVQVIDMASGAVIERLPVGDFLRQEELSPSINRARTILFTFTYPSGVNIEAQPLSSKPQNPVMAHIWSVRHGLQHIRLRAVPISLDLSPDGQRLACSFLDGAVTLVNPLDGQSLSSFDEYGHVLGFTSDGSSLLTVDLQERVLMHYGSPIRERRAEIAIGRSFAESIEAGLAEEEARKAAEEKRFALNVRRTLEGPLSEIAAVSPIENKFAVIAQDRFVRIYDFEGKLQLTSTSPGANVNCLAYSPDGSELLLGRNTGQLSRWNLKQNSYSLVLEQTNCLIKVGWLASGRAAWAKSASNFAYIGQIIDLRDVSQSFAFDTLVRNEFQSWAVSAHGQALAVLRPSDKPFGAYLVNATTGGISTELPARSCLSIAIGPDERLVAIGHAPFDITIWDSKEKRLLREIEAHSNWVVALAFSPDGKLLLSGAGDGTARVWDVENGAELGRIRFPGFSPYINSVGFSPDGKLVLAAAQGRIVIAESPSPPASQKPSR